MSSCSIQTKVDETGTNWCVDAADCPSDLFVINGSSFSCTEPTTCPFFEQRGPAEFWCSAVHACQSGTTYRLNATYFSCSAPTTCPFLQTVSANTVDCVGSLSCPSSVPVLTDEAAKLFQCYNTSVCPLHNRTQLQAVEVDVCTDQVSCSSGPAYF